MRATRWMRTIAALALVTAASVAAAAPQADERVRALEREVAELRAVIAELRAGASGDARIAELERRIAILADEVARLRAGETPATATESSYGLGPAASKVYRSTGGVSIGGYGEALYEDFSGRRDDGAQSGRIASADMLRGVVYVGAKPAERFVLNTEFEFEHASTGKGGEVSVEFATLDWLAHPAANLRAGLVLMPVGLINELHEPTVFLGSRRPAVEQAIIPTTWRELGFGLFGEVGPFSYRTYLTTGLDASKFAASGLRSSRQSGARAKAEDLAWVGRLDVTALPGLLVGFSAYVGEAGQGLRGDEGTTLAVRTRMLEAHVDWRLRGLEARALATRTTIDDVGALNRALELTGSGSVGERQDGGYLQLGYDVLGRRVGRAALVLFARLERYGTQARVPAGYERNPANDVEILTLGVAFRPLEQLVVKLDWQDVDNQAGTGVDQINLALGYVF